MTLIISYLRRGHLRDLAMYIKGHSRSLKTEPLDRPVAVCEIFSAKEWRDLKHQVKGRSRSLKMTPFDRPYATFYWSAIVNIALSCK